MKQSTYAHYVYTLVDPRTGVPFYVGKGTAYRYKAHETEARHHNNKINKAKCDHIREIWEAGLNVVYEFEPRASHEGAFDREQQLIKQHGRRVDGTGSLFNVDRGGRDRWRPKTSDRSVYVYNLTGERHLTFCNVREAATYFNCDPSVVSRVARRNKLFRDQWVVSYEDATISTVIMWSTGSRPAKRPVQQLTKDGVLVHTFASTYEAGRAVGVRPDTIYATLRAVAIGKRKTAVAGGFVWRFVD